jgi:N-methylhydantoinase A
VCLIVDGQPEIHEQAQVGAWTVNLPMLAVHSIGAGGGSLVSHSAAGLRVGPDSAGANPGPACYGRGGESPTLTDAAVILGYLQPCTDPQQSVQISKASAETAFTSLAGQLAMSRADTARGVVRVANANMARALRRISVDKGVDTRECALIAFGGAAPMYAAELAREVGIRTVIVPHNSSVLSALGCLSTTPSYTHQRTVRLAGTNWDATAYRQCCADVAAQASDSLLRGRAESTQVDLEYVAFMRYFGQSYAITVPCTPRSTGGELRSAFWNRHEALYGYRTDEPYEIQSLRVTARMQSEAIDFTPLQPSALAPAAIETVTCIFENGTANIPFYQRADLGVGHTLQGPLIIADETSTTVIPPGCSVAAMTQGHLRIDIEGSS